MDGFSLHFTLRGTSLLPFAEKINNKNRVSYHEKGQNIPPSLSTLHISL